MKVYVVNMETSVARREAIEKQLIKLGMPFEIVAAVDGRKLSEPDLAKVVFDVKEFTGAQAGCMLSHVKIYKRMQEVDDEFALILEDDSLITDPQFASMMTKATQMMNDGNIVLMTYYWCREGNLKLTQNKSTKIKTANDEYYLCKPQEVHGIGRSGAYLVSKKAAKRLLDFHTPVMRCQADSWVVYYENGVINGVDCMYPMPVTENPEFGSEIGYTKNAVELFAKRMAERAVQWNIPILANAIRQKRINFSKSYKNIVVQ